ncbi:2'-5' RNA ligase family protein [candidate division KSB1 bacterium]
MYFGLVYFPENYCREIDRIRKKYDPTFDLIKPHITVMFPVPGSAGEERVRQHVKNILAKWKPFSIRAGCLERSWDNWLLLTLRDGSEKVIELYRYIYTGLLSDYCRRDIEFVPHISLGLFIKDRAEYKLKDPQKVELDKEKFDKVYTEARALNLTFESMVDKLHLIELNDDFSEISVYSVLPLGSDL